MKNCVTKVQHRVNKKSNTNINISKSLQSHFDMLCYLIFTSKYDDKVKNTLTIR